jgi:hypothetical protein
MLSMGCRRGPSWVAGSSVALGQDTAVMGSAGLGGSAHGVIVDIAWGQRRRQRDRSMNGHRTSPGSKPSCSRPGVSERRRVRTTQIFEQGKPDACCSPAAPASQGLSGPRLGYARPVTNMAILRQPRLDAVVVTRDSVRQPTPCRRTVGAQTRRPVPGCVRGGAAWHRSRRESRCRNQGGLRTEFRRGLGDRLSIRPRSRREVAAEAGYDLALT